MKPVAILLAVLALVLAPFTLVIGADHRLPWEHFSESAKDAVNAGQGGCAGQPVLVATLVHDGTTFAYFAAENGRFVFAEMDGDTPVMIYVGAQLPSPNGDVIKVLDAHPYSEARDGSGPCAALFPANA